ncbi:helix-turn-helix domain-containing protein [Streptomyces sporangiiformans]|uniref:Helix-turn-helix domain-containing protein n=1 Tax=Streptomyces sporangiiformans TaxID=2315329 RepID=A0A505D0V5_9ACTN|nr:helix-turn-helix domain-containing protein [Streptomyces sporangiiformans]
MVQTVGGVVGLDKAELGRTLRTRRQEAGRTIASVAVDAGLSVPYIANLENGRGNPTVAALQQLAAALGFRLEIGLRGEDEGAGEGAAEPEVPDAVRGLMASPRVRAVARRLAHDRRAHVSLVAERLQDALLALGAVTGRDVGERDLERLLDLLLLSGAGLEDQGRAES